MEPQMNTEDAVMQLLHAVPAPPGEVLPPPGRREDLDAFTGRTGIDLPPDVRGWLLRCNGTIRGPGGLFGINTLRDHLEIERYYRLYPEWLRQKWVPVAGDGCGNYYVVGAGGEHGPGNPVLFVDTHDDANAPTYCVASGIWPFLRFLLLRELGRSAWPFAAEEVIAADPDILELKNVRLPWEAPEVTRVSLLLSLQRAMLGEVFPLLRGIAVEWNPRGLIIRSFVDGEIAHEDRESLDCIEGEVMADFHPSVSIVSEVVRCDSPQPLPQREGILWVYYRRELS